MLQSSEMSDLGPRCTGGAASHGAIGFFRNATLNVVGPDGKPMTEPDPRIITDLEKASELIDGLQATSPIMVACVPAANAVGQNALTFVNALVTGTAIKAATGGTS